MHNYIRIIIIYLFTLLQKATLGIHRMDYMLHYVNGQLSIKQVELNTMASGGGPGAEALKEVHELVIVE